MSLATGFERLDRRWIFLITALLVLVPLLWPLNLPLTPSVPVSARMESTLASTVATSAANVAPAGAPPMKASKPTWLGTDLKISSHLRRSSSRAL